MHRAKFRGRGSELPCLWSSWSSQHLDVITTLEASSHRHNRLLTKSPYPLPFSKSFKPLFTWLVALATAFFLYEPLLIVNSGIVERDLWIAKDAPLSPITQKITRVLEALCQEPGQKTSIITKYAHVPPITQEVTKVLEALSQELGIDTLYSMEALLAFWA